MRLPEKDRMSISREKLHADLAVSMGGRVAEEMIFGYDKVTTGASGDIQQATDMAKRMVTEWGLSDKIGMINYAKDPEQQFAPNDISDDMAKIIDDEIKAIVARGYKRAQEILKKHHDKLETVAQGLLKYETLSGEEIKELLETGEVKRVSESAADKKAAKTPRSSVPSTVKKDEPKDDEADKKVEEKPKPKKKTPPKKKKDED
jgi:cell division protease FtsH